MAFKKAVREQVWIKALLTGPSGSGKSYSALRLAKGIANKCGSDIAYIGTESSRDLFYANEFEYDLLQLTEPFTIDKYVAAIDEAVAGGYKVLIVDSLSHEWIYLNDVHDKMPGNSFTNWGKLKPKHNAFMEKILMSPIHIIGTARGKDTWTLEDKNGKQVPKKVGLGAQQDKDISYNYTVSFVIDQDTHIAHADKDNTHLFDGRYEMLTEKDGEALYDWANTGEAPAPVAEKVTYEQPTELDLKSLQKAIIEQCVKLGGQKNEKLMATVKTYVANGNPNAIKDIEIAKQCLAAISNLE